MTDLLREAWDWFLFDTLVWTGALIALVMILRRPVARYFGAGTAYALWFLPLGRLLLPPVTLPNWMAPTSEPALAPVDMAVPAAEPLAAPVWEAASTTVASTAPGWELSDMLVPIIALWLLGAAIMLVRRFHLYFQLRSELLSDARPVGEIGSIRLIETRSISGPMAFGVLDRVIALPDGFMATRERQYRDLAIEHELAHHRGGDLLVNMAVQPLFAIHWFNPLGWLGWHALRRDQEAFCDARVVNARPQEERAAYAGIIADFARRPSLTPRPALAAPMACPVLGDKSIIHRLRNLSMSELSPRRRTAGRVSLAAVFLAVPLTASISYATAAPSDHQMAIADVEEWTDADVQQEKDELRQEEAEVEMEAMADLEEQRLDMIEAETDMAEARRDMELAREEAHREWKGWSDSEHARSYAEGRREWAEGRIAYADGRRAWADSRIQWAEGRKQWAEGRKQWAAEGEAWARAHADEVARTATAHAVASSMTHVPEVIEKCVEPEQPVVTKHSADGKVKLYVCESAGTRIAISALQSTRLSINSDGAIDETIREEIVRELDREIAELRRTL